MAPAWTQLLRQLVVISAMMLLCVFAQAADSLDLVRRGTDPPWAATSRAMIASGKAADVIKSLQPQRKKSAPGSDLLFEIIWGRACLAAKTSELAEKGLASFTVPQGAYQADQSELYLVTTYVLLDRNRFAEAAKLADWIAANDEGAALALGAEACSKALVGTREYAAAVESAEFAVKYARQKLYNSDHTYDALFTQLDASLDAARRAMEIGMYGLDFVLFRDAERLRRQHQDYAKALAGYTDIIERFPLGIYADASRLYSGICLLKSGQVKQAEESLKKFITTYQDGYYVGEAMLHMARIELDYNIQPNDAADWGKRLDSWITVARNRRIPIAGFKLNPKATEKIQPPKEKLTDPDAFGNQRKKGTEPGQLVNQVTCAWYLNDLEVECAQIRGFLAFVAGKKDEAKSHFARLPNLDPDMKGGSIEKNPNDFTRLSWGLDHGYLYAYPQELELYKDRQRLAVLIADFAYITERFADCTAMLRRIIDGEFGPIAGERLEYPRFAMSSAVYWTNGKAEASKILIPFVEPGKMTWTRQRALLSLANIGFDNKDKEIAVKSDKALDLLVAVEPPTDWVMQGRLLRAQRLLAAGKKAEGIAALEAMGRVGKDWKELADFFLAEQRPLKDKP